jgi:hypothetical protein
MTSGGPVRWLRRQLDFLGSGRLTVLLLPVTLVILYLHLAIPQQGQVGERVLLGWVEQRGAWGRGFQAMGLTDVLHSWPFWSVYGLLFLNLSVCMTRRLPVVLRLCRFPDRPPRPGPGWLHRDVEVAGLRPEQVAAQLRKKGYRSLVAEQTVYALRGRLAGVGHWVFHAGLLGLLVAGGSMAAARDPFRGTVGAGEGEPFELGSAPLVSANQAVDPELPPLRFRVERIDLFMEDGLLMRFDATVSTPEGERAGIEINRPYRSEPYQVLLHGFGYMPGWVIVNPRGRALNSAWVKLAPFPLEEEDWFSLGPEDSSVTVRFYPDHQREDEQDRTLSPELRNPRFQSRIEWRGEEVYRGLLEPGERVALEGGAEFFFLPEIRRYALLDVIEESGHTPIFSCFAVIILGLLLRYARIRKEIVVQIGERSLELHGHGEIFEHLFAEELEQLAGELADAGPVPGGPGGAA